MAEFRNILADGDLIREKSLPRWWLLGEKSWTPYRNLSREVRFLEQRMHSAHAAYKAAQEDYVVAHKNVETDINMLRAYKSGNSEVSYEVPSDESILSRRDGVKYSGNNQQSQKQKGQQNGNGNNQQQKSGDQQNNQSKQKGQQRKPSSLMELLMNTKVVH